MTTKRKPADDGEQECPACGGEGEVDGQVCDTCGGAGTVDEVDIEVDRGAPTTLEWRKKKALELRGVQRRARRAGDLELRELSTGELNLTGWASVTGVRYQVGAFHEVIAKGAFKRTLSENPDVALLLSHSGLPLARTRSGTLRLREDQKGLRVNATLDPLDPDVQSLERKMRRGDVDAMSFGFLVTDDEWSSDYRERTVKAVSLSRGDVSLVAFGANDRATAALRAASARRPGGRASVPDYTTPAAQRLMVLRAKETGWRPPPVVPDEYAVRLAKLRSRRR